ncbi:MAG: c-type cytochrome [Rhodocyclaceae bacterium]|nr:c-type cytochrome [Rhodocyclaceae bacterium]
MAAALMLGAVAVPAQAEDAKTLASTVCIACHGEDGNSVVPMFPKIAGLQEEYIVKQLKDFMSGKRKSDVMGPVVANLKAEDVAPLAAHYSSLKMKVGEAADKKAVEAGKLMYQDGNETSGVPACLGCHQPMGAGKDIYPRIAGQQSEYVLQQLKNFAAGDRSNDPNRWMRSTAKRMTEAEMRAVAEYLAGLDAK